MKTHLVNDLEYLTLFMAFCVFLSLSLSHTHTHSLVGC